MADPKEALKKQLGGGSDRKPKKKSLDVGRAKADSDGESDT